MKKTVCILLVLITILFTACNRATPSTDATQTPSATPKESVLDKNCQDIIDHLSGAIEQTEYFKTRKQYSAFTPIDKDNCQWFLGKADIPISEGVAMESEISPSDYSLVVAKIKDGEDFEKVTQTIDDNISPMKWVCMGATEKGVERIDNVVIIVLADAKTVADITAAFMELK